MKAGNSRGKYIVLKINFPDIICFLSFLHKIKEKEIERFEIICLSHNLKGRNDIEVKKIVTYQFKRLYNLFQAWLGEIQEYAQDDVVIMLLGNKCDCHERVIRKEDGDRLSKVCLLLFFLSK